MTVSSDPFELIPKEIHLEILSFLGEHDLGQCLRVGRLWCHLASSDQLWKVILPRLAPGAPLPTTGFLDYLRNHAVLTKEGVSLRLQQFTQSARWFLNNSFTCFFPYNEGCTVEATLGLTVPLRGEHKEIYIFMRTLDDYISKRSNVILNACGGFSKHLVILPIRRDATPLDPYASFDEAREKEKRELAVPLSHLQVSNFMSLGIDKLKNDASVAAIAAVVAVVLGQLQAKDCPD